MIAVNEITGILALALGASHIKLKHLLERKEAWVLAAPQQ
jgi:hypothetical protein